MTSADFDQAPYYHRIQYLRRRSKRAGVAAVGINIGSPRHLVVAQRCRPWRCTLPLSRAQHILSEHFGTVSLRPTAHLLPSSFLYLKHTGTNATGDGAKWRGDVRRARRAARPLCRACGLYDVAPNNAADAPCSSTRPEMSPKREMNKSLRRAGGVDKL